MSSFFCRINFKSDFDEHANTRSWKRLSGICGAMPHCLIGYGTLLNLGPCHVMCTVSCRVDGSSSRCGAASQCTVLGPGQDQRKVDVIQMVLLPQILDGLFLDGCFLFQHDRSPVQMAASTQQHLEAPGIRQMKWPAHSPDFNPVENVLGIMKASLSAKRRPQRSADALWQAVSQI